MKTRRINVTRVISRLIVKYPEYVNGLYDAMKQKRQSGDLTAFYKNEYVKRWLSLEEQFRKHYIDVDSKDYPKGIAINLDFIEKYLDSKCDVINSFRGEYFFCQIFILAKFSLKD